MKNLKVLLSGIFAITTLGCNCKPPGKTSLTPDFVPTPKGLTFSACPTRDENNMVVQDVFPATVKLKITNQARVSGKLTLKLSGPAAANFTLGTVPESIDALDEVEVPVSFSPTVKGDVRADLIIDDNTEGTDDVVVTLTGTGIRLPSQPTLETAVQLVDGGFTTCHLGDPTTNCTLDFSDTLMNQSNTLQLKLRNLGCPTLKVTGLDLFKPTNPGSTDGFNIDSPSTLPTTLAPLTLSTADGTQETLVTVRFAPTDDGSGPQQFRSAVLSVKSNDPASGDGADQPASLSVQGYAIMPSIYVTPSSCNFANTADACGNVSRIVNKAKFRVSNSGGSPIQISQVRFRSSNMTTSSDNRFSVTQNIQGQTIVPGGNANVEVTEVDQPILVTDQLEIVADIPGMGAGSGGMVVVSVISGTKPCLTTDPMDAIDFGDPTDELTARVLKIKNGTGCGTLIVNSVTVSTQPFYSLIDPLVPANTSIPPGGSVEATVQFRRPPSGGSPLADLKIVSNDTDYGPPQHKLLLLQASAAFDPIPNPQITACRPDQIVSDVDCATGAQNSANFALSMISPDEITLSGITSTDNTMVKEYRFTLLPPLPSGATTAALANSGVKSTVNKTKLTIPPGATGTYRVGLEVWDDRGQKSANSDVISLNVNP